MRIELRGDRSELEHLWLALAATSDPELVLLGLQVRHQLCNDLPVSAFLDR